MKKIFAALVFSAVLALAAASPVFAATGADFGAHHSAHAIEMGGFTADMNPGMHQGFAGWTAE